MAMDMDERAPIAGDMTDAGAEAGGDATTPAAPLAPQPGGKGGGATKRAAPPKLTPELKGAIAAWEVGRQLLTLHVTLDPEGPGETIAATIGMQRGDRHVPFFATRTLPRAGALAALLPADLAAELATRDAAWLEELVERASKTVFSVPPGYPGALPPPAGETPATDGTPPAAAAPSGGAAGRTKTRRPSPDAPAAPTGAAAVLAARKQEAATAQPSLFDLLDAVG